ncbi:uncharacterized protein LOC122045521 isoform X2 [Zingiber officinale]|uniref:uncharacterized protein LOC122045521 isoform X2 n=1 Tax=Zingiber officinale TaxID=94328 RepID=UPI001C4BD999|nr:uncharacterized protein LOC122045521 isoform X2 [Zingiber officinale]
MVIDPGSGVILLRLRHAARIPPGSGRSDRRNRCVALFSATSSTSNFSSLFELNSLNVSAVSESSWTINQFELVNKKEKNKMLMTTLLILHSIFNHDVMWRAANFLQCCDVMGDSCKGRVYEFECDRQFGRSNN